jgi:hypothetical protein
MVFLAANVRLRFRDEMRFEMWQGFAMRPTEGDVNGGAQSGPCRRSGCGIVNRNMKIPQKVVGRWHEDSRQMEFMGAALLKYAAW